ncbi:MAG: hypothetical protein A2Z51_10875 [Deltaproteobacteria bacterium RBG_19FT_COMBO_52_11]|nr:MAG: hypothetical protein A2Z51_10875 [Deltaproteobacteria bacterium RBG_19FT_COMBO_52_11]
MNRRKSVPQLKNNKGEKRMNIGERMKFQFGGKEMEGIVTKIFPKKVYLKVDFPHHPGKIVVRKIAELEGKGPDVKKSKKKEKREKAKQERIKRREEQKGEEVKE